MTSQLKREISLFPCNKKQVLTNIINMKKFYTFLAAAMMFTASFAQEERMGLNGLRLPEQTVKMGKMAQNASVKKSLAPQEALRMQAPKKEGGYDVSGLEIINEQPEGNVVVQVRTSDYYWVFWGYIFTGTNDGKGGHLVEGSDGYYYLYDPFSNFPTASYLKLEKEGDELVAKLPQAIYHQDASTGYEDLIAYAFAMEFYEAGTGDNTYLALRPVEKQEFRFTMKGDSLLSSDTALVLGLCNDEGTCYGYADYNYRMDKFTDKLVEVDESNAASALPFALKFTDNYGYTYGYPVSGTFDGAGKVYVKGIFNSLPDAWVEGTFDGQKAVFPSSQYVGYNDTYSAYSYFEAVKEDTTTASYELADSLAFDVDLTTMTMTTADHFILNLNKHKSVYCTDAYLYPSVSLWSEKAGTPEDPYFTFYSDYDADYGYGYLNTYLPVFDTEGYLMDCNKMTYTYYVDDEPMVIYPDEYGTDEEMEELPYNFTAGLSSWNDIEGTNGLHYLCFYFTGFDKIGVQTTYYGGGETHSSNIVYYYINPDGVKGINKSMADVTSVRYTDLSGRTVQKPAHGLYIKTVTLTDGTVKSTKVMMR